MTIASATDSMPLRFGTADDFRRVGAFLRDAAFHEEGICGALGVSNMAEVGAGVVDPARLAALEPVLALLIRLLIVVDPLPAAEVEARVESSVLSSFLALDVLRRASTADGAVTYASTVLLYPVAGALVASDRGDAFADIGEHPLQDVVFPAFYHGTLRFLRLLPRTAANEALDLCAGTGIGALVLSRHAGRVVAADITARAAHFGRFNQLLNDCHNVDVAQGDLYEPVKGRLFDVIAAHPPYVPAESVTQVYRDGGLTGEAIVQRVVEGLPEYLRPGGILYMMCAAWDTADAPFERRVRSWLGVTEQEFDVVFAVQQQMSASMLAESLARRAEGKADARGTDYWARVAPAEAGLSQYATGALVVRRADAAGAGRSVTCRPHLTDATTGADFPWLLDRMRWLSAQEASGTRGATLLAARARLAPYARLNVVYQGQPGGPVPEKVVLQTTRPFGASIKLDPWVLGLMLRLGGEQNLEGVYRGAREAGGMPPAFEAAHLAGLVAMGFERGVFELDCGPTTPVI